MAETIDIDVWVGDLRGADSLREELPEYMNECSDDVRTHRVGAIRWVDERRTVGHLSYEHQGLVADVLSSEENGGSECCGGAAIGFSVRGVPYVREISYGH